MAKERITLLADDGKLIYTLGAISDTSEDVLILEYPIFKSGTSSMFEEKDLVSKIFDKESFSQLCTFNIMPTLELKRLRIANQPYKLQIGSQVRFEKKLYDVIGFFYNTFAQLNIISPILFNYSEIIIDVNALLFALKSNTEIEEIINKNIREKKYDNELNFPFLAGISNFKKYFSKILKPPFTTLETIKIKQDVREFKGGEEIIPLRYYGDQISGYISESELRDDWQSETDSGNLLPPKGVFVVNWSTKVATFYEVSEFESVVAYSVDGYFGTNTLISNFKITTQNKLEDLKLPFQFFNVEKYQTKIKNLNENEKYYQTNVGLIPKLIKGFLITSKESFTRPYNSIELDTFGQSGFTPILYTTKLFETDRKKYEFLSLPFGVYRLIFQNLGNLVRLRGLKKVKDLDKLLELPPIAIRQLHEEGFRDFEIENLEIPEGDKGLKAVQLILEEEKYYGDFFVSSGSPKNNSITNKKILPFGSIVKISGVWWYILKYISTDINDLENLDFCLCAKASTRDSVLPFTFLYSTKTEGKGRFKFIETEKIYKASLKNKLLPNLPKEIFSGSRESQTLIEKNSDKNKIVTNIFLEKRIDQLELLNKNFPKLNETFMGILDVLDKKIRKPKKTIKKSNTEDFVYCLINNTYFKGKNVKFTYQTSYDDNKKDREIAKEILKQYNQVKILNSLNKSKHIDVIPKDILQIAFATFILNFNYGDNTFVLTLENFKQYQLLYITRNAYLYKTCTELNSYIKKINTKNGYKLEDYPTNKVRYQISNTLSPLSSSYFFRNISPILMDSYFGSKGGERTYNILLGVPQYNSQIAWLFTKEKIKMSKQFNPFEFAQFSFVFSVLNMLFKELQTTLLLHLEENAEQKIRNLGIVKFLQQFDLNINLLPFKKGLYRVLMQNENSQISIKNFELYSIFKVTKVEEKKEYYKKLDEKLQNGKSPFNGKEFENILTSTIYDINDEGEDGENNVMTGLTTFVRMLDNVYFNVLDLRNKITLGNRNLILQNFPNVDKEIEEIKDEIIGVEEDVFTEDKDIFEEALQDLGDEFLDKELLEEIENIDISDF